MNLCSYPLKFFLPDKLGITPDSSERMSFSNVTMHMLGVDSQDPSLSTQQLVPKFVPSQVVIPKVVAASQTQQLEWGSLIFNPFNFKSFKKLFSFRVCVCFNCTSHNVASQLVSYFEYSLDVGIWMEDQFMPAVFYELVL